VRLPAGKRKLKFLTRLICRMKTGLAATPCRLQTLGSNAAGGEVGPSPSDHQASGTIGAARSRLGVSAPDVPSHLTLAGFYRFEAGFLAPD